MGNQLVVAGFHRSGTSLLCQLLHRAGLFLGYEMLGTTFSNPHGHFEDVEVLALHRDILADNGLTWRVDAPFLPVITAAHRERMRRIVERREAEHELWGFKDPRACLFMMLWKHALPRARVLVIYRHFADATYSLERRQATEMFSGMGSREKLGGFWERPDLALRMWLAHNEALLTFARTFPDDTMAVSVDMVQEGFPVVTALDRRWGLGLEEVPPSEVYDAGATRGRPGRQPVSDRRLICRVGETWSALEELGEATKRMMRGETVLADG